MVFFDCNNAVLCISHDLELGRIADSNESKPTNSSADTMLELIVLANNRKGRSADPVS